VKTYACSTGEHQGQKRQEKDEKTPEGIYFNTKAFRDTKVTVFGDRAFGLNYPDAFDDLAGNTGSGIFIHGSDRALKPFGSNGCVVLDNADLADLDQRIAFDRTPIIIGNKLPYRFAAGARSLSGLVALLRPAMVPVVGPQKPQRLEAVTVLGFANHMVALGRVGILTDPPQHGLTRIYLAGADPQLVVLLKREWNEVAGEPPKAAIVAAASRTKPAKGPAMAPAESEPAVKPGPAAKPEAVAEAETSQVRTVVESWRRAWEQKNLADYIAYYHPGFSADGRNLSQWRQYKEDLNQRYKFIRIGVRALTVNIEGESAQAFFEQHYSSDAFRSRTFKVIELRKKGGDWKIYREITHKDKPGNWPG
jgi:murein L,D-transpeptidase YafK